MRAACRILRIEDLVLVPDLHLRHSAQVNAAVRFRDRLVFDQEFHVAERLIGVGVGAVAVIDQFALLDPPVLGKFVAHFLQCRFALLACELCDGVGVQSMPASEILAVEQRAKAFGRFNVGGVE